MAKDLVCGMEVQENKNAVEYEGKKYSFCSPKCKEDFKKDPEKYIKTQKPAK
ncbi:MAG: YHS domain-containing protein [Candidatus Margulisbacteria bacterium]|nr:YHS domain-containing protein [Candidatus Margulisiibacteriota bacterium]